MWQETESDYDDNVDDPLVDSTTSEIPSPPLFILGIVERSSTIYEQFLSLAHTMGFTCRRIDYHEYLENGIVPVSCQEYGGRVTKLFELSLRPSVRHGETPLLLLSEQERRRRRRSQNDTTVDTENDDDDNSDVNYTVGKLYQHSTFLPC